MDKLILASTSQRRKEILEKFSIPFSVEPSPYEEVFTDEHPEIQVLNLSKNKIELFSRGMSPAQSTLLMDASFILDATIGRRSVRALARQWRRSRRGTGWPAISQERDEIA